jgi:putative MATE family efflux protein
MPSIKFSRIWKIAYPIIVGNVAQNLLIITDTAFLGHLDAVSLGAAALGGVFYMAVMMLGLGFSIGVQIIVARRYGEERYESIGTVLHHALLFMVPFALALWCLLRFTGDGILSHLVKSSDVMNGVSQFLSMRIWGILFGFTIYVCQSFFVGIARTKIILPTTCVIVAVNILLDWAMIFGHLGFEATGIRGAALASAISEMAGVAVYFFYICILRKQDFRGFGIFRRLSYATATMRNLVKISVPASLQNFLSIASWFIFFAMVEKIGEQELAISNIGRSLYAIFLLPVWGFSAAVNSLVSYSMGCRKPLLIYPITGKVVFITALSILLVEGVTYVFSDFVTSIYTDIPSLGEATVAIMPTICISALVFGISFICFNTISGTGNTHISLFIEIIATCIYVAICILSVEVWHWGIMYVWLVDGFYGVVMIIASLIYLSMGKWMKRKV